MEGVDRLTRQTRGAVYYTAREKTFSDGSSELLICDRPIFGGQGWEPHGEKPRKVSKKTDTDKRTEANPADVQRSARRAAAALRDIALCNDFRVFVTLTLDQTKVDRYDAAAVVKKLSQWADNAVRRDGLRYVLVPELHKDGAIHFHGFFGWDDPAKASRWLVDSGTLSVPGHKKPIRPRSDAHRRKLLDNGAHIVYNLPRWRLGFTTAIELYGEYRQAVAYVCKYVRKQTVDAAGKVGGRWYYHGGCPGRPLVRYTDQSIRDWTAEPDAYRFDVPEAGLSFIRIFFDAPKGE